VTVGAVVTLFVIMQITGRTDWTRAFAGTPVERQGPPGQPVYAGMR
jgi:hypothetical protein